LFTSSSSSFNCEWPGAGGGPVLRANLGAGDHDRGGPTPDAAGQAAAATTLTNELLAGARKTLPNDSPLFASVLADSGAALLQLGAFGDAEPLLRECLGIRARTQPDAWTTFNTRSQLGGALLGQKKYADAEPLLLAGYRGMKECETQIPPQGKIRLTEALERLVQLYDSWGKKDETVKWRKELEATQAAQGKPERLP
jgi:eukaryotic-like serine/threonine-protein kinase